MVFAGGRSAIRPGQLAINESAPRDGGSSEALSVIRNATETIFSDPMSMQAALIQHCQNITPLGSEMCSLHSDGHHRGCSIDATKCRLYDAEKTPPGLNGVIIYRLYRVEPNFQGPH